MKYIHSFIQLVQETAQTNLLVSLSQPHPSQAKPNQAKLQPGRDKVAIKTDKIAVIIITVIITVRLTTQKNMTSTWPRKVKSRG